MEKNYLDKIRLVRKMSSIWTYKLDAWSHQAYQMQMGICKKSNGKNKITKYKSWLVAQGFA